MMELTFAQEERLAKPIDFLGETGCWIWTGKQTSWGYALVTIARAGQAAHRVIYELMRGDIPEGFVIDHLCSRKLCMNPTHMEAVPHGENVSRAQRGRARSLDAPWSEERRAEWREYMRSWRARQKAKV